MRLGMAPNRSPAAAAGRALAVLLAAAAIVAIVAVAVGGLPWLESPTIWGVALFVAAVVLVADRVRRHPSRNILLGLPVVIGGALAIALGAQDYLPWFTSPATWLGLVISILTGVWLVRTGRAAPRDVAEGMLLGLIVFGLGLLALFAGVVFFWMIWRPLG